MVLVDLHTHPRAHGDVPGGSSIWDEFISAARKKGLRELGFSDHDWVLKEIDWDYMEKIKKQEGIKIRCGLEIEYIPGREREIKLLQQELPLDYCIGSVHYLGDWNFDHPDYRDKFRERKVDTIYEDYFGLLKQAVESELFDIIGHFDLIKIFGFRPENRNVLELAEPVLQAIKKRGLVMEINTNGLNKPVGEIYPSREIVGRACSMGISFTLGSDAHTPERVGEGLTRAALMLSELGCSELVSFERGRKITVS